MGCGFRGSLRPIPVCPSACVIEASPRSRRAVRLCVYARGVPERPQVCINADLKGESKISAQVKGRDKMRDEIRGCGGDTRVF